MAPTRSTDVVEKDGGRGWDRTSDPYDVKPLDGHFQGVSAAFNLFPTL
jgi:hypothetical protein